MSALAHHSLGVPGVRSSVPATPRQERHLQLVWSRPEPLAQHVYRRRQAVAFLAVLTLAAAVFFGVQAGVNWVKTDQPAATAIPAVPVGSTDWVVSRGDTLWSIATATSKPGTDVRPLVAQMSKERNGKPLQLGERISVNR